MTDLLRQFAADTIASALATAFPDKLAIVRETLQAVSFGLAQSVYARLETPKDSALGDYAFPTFFLAKSLRQNPQEIARAIQKHIDHPQFSAVGPYINYSVSAPDVARLVLPDVSARQSAYGSQSTGAGKTVIIDFSSPNIAKPFGVGHLRSTAIGHALYRLHEKLGYTVVGINHLGDWGTQFGKMIVAYRAWGDPARLQSEPIDHLYQLYTRFHAEEEQNPALTEEARLWFKKLEDGDAEAEALWVSFKEHSLREFRRVYDLLGVHFDYYTGESFYNDKMDPVITHLREAGLVRESQGALVVDLSAYNLNPCLLRKADGATLYATRDLAGILYRYETFRFHKALYVVGSAQQEHFRQVFKVIELLQGELADRLVHVSFGWIRFQDEAMSTRRGNIVFLDDVLATAIDKVKAIVHEKNPSLPNLERTARQVGVGAVIFSDLAVARQKDINFVWDEVLNFEGATGPYLQYTHARLAALLRKYGQEIRGDVDYELYTATEEKALLMHLYRFGQTVELSAEKYEPSIMAEYLLELAAVFNRFYQRKDSQGRLIKIIAPEQPDETRGRMLLVAAVRAVMKEGLRLLGIEAPEEM